MPLSRQLLLIVSAVLALGFVGALVINVHDTRVYLSQQLASHAQDTATSHGLTLSQHLANGDVGHAESYVDATFDRGYYRQIVVEGLDGQHLIDRVVPVRVDGVPDWFVRLLPLTTPRASAAVQAGWSQLGQVAVISHPGYAYQKLWAAARKTFWWCLSLFVVSAGAVTLAVRSLLRPLAAVERQAIAISERDFRRLDLAPRTRELARVVTAMNDMVARVEGMLEAQRAQAERLREEVYVDPTTRVGNLRAFERDVAKLVSRHEEHAFGAVVVASVGDLQTVNRAGGLEAGDALLRQTGERLGAVLEGESGSVARLGGAVFAAVLLDADRDEAERLAAAAIAALSGLSAPGVDTVAVHLGVAFYNGGQGAEDLTASARAALRNAEREPSGTWLAYAPAETPEGPELFEEERWRELLEHAIDKVRVTLLAQPVRSADLGETLHEEILARLKDEEGRTVPAGVFFPMAARLGLTAALDRIVIEAVIWHVRRNPDARRRFALNVAHASVTDRRFRSWLLERLESDRAVAASLSFEITAHTARSATDEVFELGAGLRALRVPLGLDRVGAAELGFDAVRRLAPEYIKIDGAFVHGIGGDRDRQAYLRSLVAVGQGLESQVVAEFVESEEELLAVRRLGFDAVQGHHVGPPEGLAGSPARTHASVLTAPRGGRRAAS